MSDDTRVAVDAHSMNINNRKLQMLAMQTPEQAFSLKRNNLNDKIAASHEGVNLSRI